MKYLAVCSKHFRNDNYEVMFPGLTNVNLQRRLWKAGIGICVSPTIQAPCVSGESKPESKRAERKVRNALLSTHDKLVAFPRHLAFNKFLSSTHFVFANALMVFESTFLKNVSLCLSLFRGRKTPWKVRTFLAKRTQSTPSLKVEEARSQLLLCLTYHPVQKTATSSRTGA